MKRLSLIVLSLFLALASFSQTAPAAPKPKVVTPYVALGISVSNGDKFSTNSYPSIEGGVSFKNASAGIAVGRGNMDFTQKDQVENYWAEIKTSANTPIGTAVKGYGVFGAGMYFNTSHTFIEYGVGIIYPIKAVDLSIGVSNWDSKCYLNVGISTSL